MLTKIQRTGQQAYKTELEGKSLAEWINDLIDGITQAGGGSVYNVADVAARDAINNPDGGAITFISDANGSGDPGISGYDGTSWNSPFLFTGAGSSSTQYATLTSGNLAIVVGYQGSVAPALTVNGVGDYTVDDSGSELVSLDILGDNTTITGTGDFIIRVDGLRPVFRRWLWGIWNADNGAAHDAFANGNNPTRSVAGTVLSLSFPNMQPFGATGFEIQLR